MAEEREEGEIVDEISSDEELSMRRRILELEAKNEELEQIAIISCSAANEYISDYLTKNATTDLSSNFNEPVPPEHVCSWATQRAGQVPTDASSISSVEFTTPKKQKRRKTKGSKNKTYDKKSKDHCRRYHNRGHRQGHDFVKNKRRNIYQRIIIQEDFETISLDSGESTDEERVEDKNDRDKNVNGSLYLSRDELRFALARSTKKDVCSNGSLKERLLKDKNQLCDKRTITNKRPVPLLSSKKDDIEEVVSDNSSSLEEQELRLIALKSAIIKKHYARKKRNAELAYSPTDFEDMLVGAYDNMDIVNVELDNLQGEMEISPATSPKLLLSPIQFIEDRSNSASMDAIANKGAVDTKPIDMDIVNSESEEDTLMNMPEINNCSQIGNIPLPTGMCLPEFDLSMPFNSLEYTTQVPYGIYMPEASYEPPRISASAVPPPPLPAVVEDSPPPPPPFMMTIQSDDHYRAAQEQNFYSMKYISRNEDETLENIKLDFDAEETRVQTDRKIKIKSIVSISENTIPDMELNSQENSQEPSQHHNENSLKKNEEDEGEEEALRALLLSQYQSPKNQKKNANQQKAQKLSSPVKTNFSQETDCSDADTLRSLLLTNMPDQNIRKTPTESILKEAVRRLKVKEHITDSTFNLKSTSEAKDVHDKSRQQSLSRSPPIDQKYFINSANERDAQSAIKVNSKEIPIANNVKENDLKSGSENSENSAEICETPKVNVKSVESINEEYVVEMEERTRMVNTLNKNNLKLVDFNNKFGNFVEQQDEVTGSVDDTISAKEQEQAKNNESMTESTVVAEKVAKNALPVKQAIKEKTSDETTSVHATDIGSESISAENLSAVSNEVVETIATRVSEKEIAKVPLNASNEEKGTSATIIPNLKTADEIKTVKIKSPVIKKVLNTSSTHTQLGKLCDVNKITESSTSEILKKSSFATVATAPPDALRSLRLANNMSSFTAYKIVKPNKVINKNPDLKRKSVETSEHLPQNKVEKLNIDHLEHSTASNSSTTSTPTSSRLVTSVDLKSLKVSKLIISVPATESDSETCNEEESWSKNPTTPAITAVGRCETPESFEKMNISYDNTSPMSLQMDSGGTTPTRSKSPNAIEISETCTTDMLEQKIESFLRNARSKVQQTASTENNTIVPEVENIIPTKTISYSTPVAVRHLPTAAQQEYRRLVHRMNMLEKQKQLKADTSDTTKNSSKRKLNHNSSPLQEIERAAPKTSTLTSLKHNLCPMKITPNAYQSSGSNVLIRKVLVKNAVNKKMIPTKTVPSSTTEKPCKANVLRAYETSFLKIGVDIISNLDKSLQLVEEAKKTKLAKLSYEQRLKELRSEIELAQDKLKLEQQKMSSIYPQITRSNNDITSLTQKRVKLFKAANNLGKIVKGEEYRLNNDLKKEITIKSKKLATDIKLVNSLTHCDLDRTENIVVVSPCDEHDTTTNHNVEIKESDLDSTQPMKTSAVENSKEMIVDGGIENNIETSTYDIIADKPQLVDNSEGIIAEVQTENLLVSNKEMNTTLNEITETAKELQDETPLELTNKKNEVRVQLAEHIHDQQEECNFINEASELTEETKALREYISPLTHLRHYDSRLDPNGIICPYELMGQCEDKDCKYMHLTEKNLNSA